MVIGAQRKAYHVQIAQIKAWVSSVARQAQGVGNASTGCVLCMAVDNVA
jgi:hypothetical protein